MALSGYMQIDGNFSTVTSRAAPKASGFAGLTNRLRKDEMQPVPLYDPYPVDFLPATGKILSSPLLPPIPPIHLIPWQK